MSVTGYRKWAVEEFGLKAELLDDIQNEVAGIQKIQGDTLMTRYAK